MFILRNTVKITSGGETVIAHNEIKDFRSYIYANEPYAQFILAGGGGRLYCERAQLVSSNTDVLKGALYAEYSAQFSSSDCDGTEFSRCGLSGDGATLCNEAVFQPVVKETGKPVFVSVTVYVSGAGGGAPPITGGDNPLAALFLGYGALRDAGYVCTDFNMDDVRFCGFSDAGAIKPCDFTAGSGGIAFGVNTDDLNNETVFTANGRPVVKSFNIGAAGETAVFSAVPNEQRCVALDYPYVNYVVGVNQNGSAVDTSMLHCFDKIYKVDGIIPFRAGAGARLEADPLGRFAALKSDNVVTVYGVSGDLPVKRLTVKAEADEEFYLCAGGYFALFSPSRLKIMRPDGSIYCSHAIGRGLQNVIVNEGTAFHVCVFNGSVLRRYRVTPDTMSNLTAFTLPQNTVLFQSFFRVGAAAQNIGYYFDTNTTTTQINTVLYGLFHKYGAVTKIAFGSFAALLETQNHCVCVNLFTGDAVSVDRGGVCGMWGDLTLTGEGGTAALRHYRPGDGKAVKISGADFDASTVQSACILGGFIVVLHKNGGISTYYRNKNGAFIYSPMFNTTQPAIVTLRQSRLSPSTKRLDVRAEFCV